MDFLYSAAITVVSLFVLLWITTKWFGYVRSQWQPAHEIAVGTFTAAGVTPDIATSAGATLGSKLERFKRYARADPSGFGLIQTPVLVSVPEQVRERQNDASKRLEAMNLKVKDVQVNEVVKFVQTLFEPSRPTLEGTVTDYGDRVEVRADLIWKSHVLDSWVASRAKPTPFEPGRTGQILNELYDDLLFQMIFDLPRNSKLHWSVESKGDNDTPNWQTLEAMTLGLESLGTYRRTLNYDDLQRSLNYLERIPVHAPGYAVGHYFLAVALGEDRQEERAANVFGQIEGMNATIELKWSAKFQRAAAMLRQYKSQAASDAAESLLKPLIQELQKAGTRKDAQGRFARRLLPLALAQLSYTYGTLFTLTTPIPKSELATRAEATWNSARAQYDAASDWSSEQEKSDVLSWVRNAEGYSRFRIAQWNLEQSRKAEQEQTADFKAACEVARGLLEEANRARPNQYEVLQNEAMILDDERYDPTGELAGEAESLYERTKRFVPRDYYQYERLARIYWRRARTQFVTTFRRNLINLGLENVKVAQSYRPNARTAALCGTYFSIAAASGDTDPAKKKENIQAAISQARLVLELKANVGDDKKPIASDAAKLMQQVAGTLDDKDDNKKTLVDLARQLNDEQPKIGS